MWLVMFWSQNSTEFTSLPSLPVQNSYWRIESEPADRVENVGVRVTP